MTETPRAKPPVPPELVTDEQIASYLSEALARGESTRLLYALKNVAWARLLSQLAHKLGIPRPQIVAMMNGEAPLTMDFVVRLLAEFQVKLSASPHSAAPAHAQTHTPTLTPAPTQAHTEDRGTDTAHAVPYIRKF